MAPMGLHRHISAHSHFFARDGGESTGGEMDVGRKSNKMLNLVSMTKKRQGEGKGY